jgi:hypothetical protein
MQIVPLPSLSNCLNACRNAAKHHALFVKPQRSILVQVPALPWQALLHVLWQICHVLLCAQTIQARKCHTRAPYTAQQASCNGSEQ